jgi:tetratricopeptide (TPR) repeat protein
MARKKLLGVFAVGMVGLCVCGSGAHAGEDALQKNLQDLNLLTGSNPRQGALKSLIDDKEHTRKLLEFALPAAKKKDISYTAALVLGLAAAEMKDMKTAEVYFLVCMDQAAKLQSFEKLSESYVLLIRIYYDYKLYADSGRICKALLELNTDDGQDRIVITTMTNRFGEVEFRDEGQNGFNTAARLRPYVREIYIKAIAKQGKYDQAIKMVDNLLKKKSDWRDQYLKGWVLREAGKLEDAVVSYEDVIKGVARDNRLEQDEKDEFIEQYRYEVSNIYVELKQIDQATGHLEFLLKKHPNNPVYCNDLGYVLADHDMKLDEAEKLIRKAIDLDRERRKKSKNYDPKTDQDSGAFLDSLGWVLHKQKKNEEAKDWLMKALQDKSAQHIEIFDHLGDVHMALGEREAAIRAWQSGLKAVGDNRRDQAIKDAVEKKLAKAKDEK